MERPQGRPHRKAPKFQTPREVRSVPDSQVASDRKCKAEEELSKQMAKDMMLVACSIEISDKDFQRFLRTPEKSAIWLSQRMMEKSKEVSCRTLSQAEKEEFTGYRAPQRLDIGSHTGLKSLRAEGC